MVFLSELSSLDRDLGAYMDFLEGKVCENPFMGLVHRCLLCEVRWGVITVFIR